MKMTPQTDQKGFTIIELLIATTVLSTILVLVTAMMINISNLYYKGINQARVQDSARTITDDVAQHLKLNNMPPTTGSANYWIWSVWPPQRVTVNAYCMGATRYSYIVGQQIGGGTNAAGETQIPHVLWRDTITAGASCTPANIATSGLSGGTEMVPPNSRLTYFQVSGISPYTVQVGVAYGDIDLMNLNTTGPTATNCKSNTGYQFCATAGLTTTATQRL